MHIKTDGLKQSDFIDIERQQVEAHCQKLENIPQPVSGLGLDHPHRRGRGGYLSCGNQQKEKEGEAQRG